MKNKTSRRLDSIKAAHESEKSSSISDRVEDYLEVISELVDMKGYAATLDISRYMNVSAPSVTKMLKKLDAEGIEHHLNPKTIRQIRKFVTFFKANPKLMNSFNEF